jgi:hypothetical protein
MGLTVENRQEAAMDTGLSIRPTAGGVAQATLVRPEPAPARQAVATELAPAQSVTAGAESASARNQPTPQQARQDRQLILDMHSREVIFRVVDTNSGMVVRQVPDEALLRLRAYTRGQDGTSRPKGEQTNFET